MSGSKPIEARKPITSDARPSLWAALKARAAMSGKSLSDELEEALLKHLRMKS